MNATIIVATACMFAVFAPSRSVAAPPAVEPGAVELPSPLRGKNLPPTLKDYIEQKTEWSFMPKRHALMTYRAPLALIESRPSEYRMPIVKPARHHDDRMARIITDEEARVFRMPIVGMDEKTKESKGGEPGATDNPDDAQ